MKAACSYSRAMEFAAMSLGSCTRESGYLAGFSTCQNKVLISAKVFIWRRIDGAAGTFTRLLQSLADAKTVMISQIVAVATEFENNWGAAVKNET